MIRRVRCLTQSPASPFYGILRITYSHQNISIHRIDTIHSYNRQLTSSWPTTNLRSCNVLTLDAMDACQTIRNCPGIFERMRRSMMRCVRRALNLVEGILITYYKCTLSAITHKLNVSGHMLIWTFVLVLVCGTRAQSLSAPFCRTLYKERNI
jgi:hypothetical protein